MPHKELSSLVKELCDRFPIIILSVSEEDFKALLGPPEIIEAKLISLLAEIRG